MATYTTLDRRNIDRLLENYDVGSIDYFTPLAGGKANSSILITTGRGRFVLSVCDEKNSYEIQRLTSLLEYLQEHDFPSTRIIRTRSGSQQIEYMGNPVYLKEYIDGRVEEQLSPSMAYQAGTWLARLHAIPAHPELPEHFSYGIESFAEVAEMQPPDVYSAWLSARAEYIAAGCEEGLPRGFVHGDLFADNMLFSGEQLVAILDFEEACNYFLLFDLGMCASGCCTVDGHFSHELAAALVNGYQTIRKLSPMEQQLFQLHIEYGAVATSFWRYRQYNIRHPERNSSLLYQEMLHLADQVRAIPRDAFLRKIFG